jgi:hypothetical protein
VNGQDGVAQHETTLAADSRIVLDTSRAGLQP